MAGTAAVKPKRGSAVHELRLETERAKALVASIAEILADDDQAKQDAIEGQTNLLETIDKAVSRVSQIEGMVVGITTETNALSARKSRLEKQADMLRAAIIIAMEEIGKCSHEAPGATISLRSTGRKLQIVDESAIPTRFWKPQAPVLDKNKLRIAINGGEVVSGAQLDNGGLTLNISRR